MDGRFQAPGQCRHQHGCTIKYQRQLLGQAQQVYHQTPISEATVRAYLATPRHLFVRRYRERASHNWCDVNQGNLHQHLAVLYDDRSITLFGDDDDNIPSTISQPSFVLRMLDLLQLQPGQTVFELGTGSGWNAALIGRLVGPSGRVFSVEIIPELARRAADRIAQLGIANVTVVTADVGEGYAAGGPYDRITFTAGTYNLPRQFYDSNARSRSTCGACHEVLEVPPAVTQHAGVLRTWESANSGCRKQAKKTHRDLN